MLGWHGVREDFFSHVFLAGRTIAAVSGYECFIRRGIVGLCCRRRRRRHAHFCLSAHPAALWPHADFKLVGKIGGEVSALSV